MFLGTPLLCSSILNGYVLSIESDNSKCSNGAEKGGCPQMMIKIFLWRDLGDNQTQNSIDAHGQIPPYLQELDCCNLTVEKHSSLFFYWRFLLNVSFSKS